MKAVVVAALTTGAVLSLPARRVLIPATTVWNRDRAASSPTAGDPTAECLSVLDSMVVLLQSGTAAREALDLATKHVRQASTDTASGWQDLAAQAACEDDVAAAWDDLAHRWSCPALGDVATAWRMSVRYGCPLAEAMAAAAGGVRSSARHRASMAAAVAGARATMGVLLVLPLVGVGLGFVLGVDVLGAYVGTTGLVTLWPGLTLLWLGRRWADRMVRRALYPDVAGTRS